MLKVDVFKCFFDSSGYIADFFWRVPELFIVHLVFILVCIFRQFGFPNYFCPRHVYIYTKYTRWTGPILVFSIFIGCIRHIIVTTCTVGKHIIAFSQIYIFVCAKCHRLQYSICGNIRDADTSVTMRKCPLYQNIAKTVCGSYGPGFVDKYDYIRSHCIVNAHLPKSNAVDKKIRISIGSLEHQMYDTY